MAFVPLTVRKAAGVVVPTPRSPEIVVVASVEVPTTVRPPDSENAPETDRAPAKIEAPCPAATVIAPPNVDVAVDVARIFPIMSRP